VSAAAVGIVDYGMGNRRSVEKALEHVGVRARISSDRATLAECDGLILPGVGAFPEAMRRIRAAGFDGLVAERLAVGIPVLGVCLGMQLLFESTEEHGGAEGLGLLPGPVERLRAPGLKLPHIGWNLVTWKRASPLTDGLPEATAFYHVHSFVVSAREEADVLGTGDYGGPFPSAIERGRLFGVQFHPEKSSVHGLALLRNFGSICARARDGAEVRA
jgi:imidazole glycerol-phosphate synthase subunit HisH